MNDPMGHHVGWQGIARYHGGHAFKQIGRIGFPTLATFDHCFEPIAVWLD